MPKIIALTGVKGCGKDTTANILATTYGTKSVAFADPIKHEVMRIFNLKSIEQYDTFKRSVLMANDVNLDTVPGRQVVREIGMLMRKYDVNQFVDYVDEKINSEPDTIWVVTDLRFDNEIIHLKNLGAKIVKIKRTTIDVIDTHITERGFEDNQCDIVIENQTTLQEYEAEVLKLFGSKLKEWSWL